MCLQNTQQGHRQQLSRCSYGLIHDQWSNSLSVVVFFLFKKPTEVIYFEKKTNEMIGYRGYLNKLKSASFKGDSTEGWCLSYTAADLVSILSIPFGFLGLPGMISELRDRSDP